MIQVRYCDINELTQAVFDRYLEILPDALLRDVVRYRFFSDRAARLIGRLLIRKALTETGYTPQLLASWQNDHNKKPFIRHWLPFNISHSKNIVVLAYSKESVVGVDIEYVDAKLDIESSLSYFRAEEQRLIAGSLLPRETFLDLWVKKEAVLKAHGKGIIDGLDQIDCANEIVSYEEQEWYLKKIPVDERYICYVAVNNAAAGINLRCVPVADLT